jgi:hypothetical protein
MTEDKKSKVGQTLNPKQSMMQYKRASTSASAYYTTNNAAA